MNELNGLTTLHDLLAISVIEVPPFQRAYAWEPTPHVRDFLDDLKAHPTAGPGRYFLGTILLSGVPGDAGDRFHQQAVVDGQQRLTTACIFVACAEWTAGYVGAVVVQYGREHPDQLNDNTSDHMLKILAKAFPCN